MTVDSPIGGSDTDPAAATRRVIKSIRVRGLHGKFEYELDIAPLPEQGDGDLPPALATVTDDRLTLLYGNNGTGKTSLLRLLFHALSPAGNRGHRNALRRIRFREFRVDFHDGTYVVYARNRD